VHWSSEVQLSRATVLPLQAEAASRIEAMNRRIGSYSASSFARKSSNETLQLFQKNGEYWL